MKAKISSKAENSNDAGKTWFSIGLDGKSYSTFDKKLYDKYVIGDEVNYDTKQNGKYTNLVDMWKDGEAPATTAGAGTATTNKVIPPSQPMVKDQGYNRCNANNNATAMMDIYERAGQLDGRTPLDMMQIKARQVQLELAFLETGKYENLEPSQNFIKTGGA